MAEVAEVAEDPLAPRRARGRNDRRESRECSNAKRRVDGTYRKRTVEVRLAVLQ